MSGISQIGYVLAGGSSRRMGCDKLFETTNGLTLIERTTQTCASQFEKVKLVVRDTGRFNHLPYQTVTDWPHAEGPLAGVIAALLDCPDECCFITAADLYDLSLPAIEKIIGAYHGEDYLGVAEAGRPQPLCGVYSQSALSYLQSRALRGKFGVRAALEGLRWRMIDVEQHSWRNVNTPDDLRAVRELT